jgi:GPH family glycoside/pentoside/hexuronide:cation symporter
MITLKDKVGYGFGDMASSMFWKIFGMYLAFFYTEVFGISAAAAGTMFLITRLWDSFYDILVGIAADRTKTRWGRYRPYLLWFAIPFAVIGAFTFFVPYFGSTGKLIYAYVTYSFMMIIYSTINVPYASLLGVMSSEPKERNVLSSYRMSFAFIGSFITFMLLQPLVDYFGKGGARSAIENISTEPIAWTKAVAIIGAICVVLFYLCFRYTKERVVEIKQSENISVKEDLKLLMRNNPWWILVATGLAALIFNALRDTVAVFYFKYHIIDNYRMGATGWTLTTIYFLVGQAANIIGVAIAPSLSNKFGKKNTYIIAMVIAAFLSCGFFFIDNITGIMALQITISICAGYVLPLLWSMFSDICDHQELTTGHRSSGLIFSSSSMSQKIGWAIGPAMVLWIMAAFGYVAPGGTEAIVQPDSAIFGMKLLISFLPAIACLLAVVGMMFYPLSDEKVKENAIELDKKRAGK